MMKSSSPNQIAAKALKLRFKGNHQEAEEVVLKRKKEYDADVLLANKDDTDSMLAQKIASNKQCSTFVLPDDEYDFDDGPRRKTQKKGGHDHKLTDISNLSKHILTQQERCHFCFENRGRPRHHAVAIANFTYLSLPHWQSIVPGHCCILTLQHESATRGVDNNVWDEVCNFKECLTMMFLEQSRDLVFIETVMGLEKQSHHCLIECIPLPQHMAKQAPLYFKKAIEEAEDEWSQHNSKKLIDTSEKGLRRSIPKDFPYFHVEFGLNKGFVHIIEDEKQFKRNFGLNIIRGMLGLPQELSYRKRDSVETRQQAMASFVQNWERFDWRKKRL